MNPNELMIGDWVLYKREPYQIRELGIYGVNRDGEDYPAVCIGKSTGIGLIVERNKIKPISLTPEILEKNGFSHIMYSDAYYSIMIGDTYVELRKYENMAVWFNWEENNDGVYADYILPMPEFVHQLQHALRICGVGKEIEL